MPTFVDLLWQVKNKLPIKFGGTGNDLGAARNMVMLAYMNDTGGALALGTCVKRGSGGHDDLRVTPTTSANDLGFLGVVVGRFTEGDGLFEPVAPAHQETVAVCISGRCEVLVEAAVTQGQYAYVSATAGKAAGVTAAPLGSIGRFDRGGSTSGQVVLGNRAAITAPEDVYEDGSLVVDSFQILDFGNGLDARASGTAAAIEVDPTYLELDAEQVAIEDTGAYFTAPSPASGTETLRPTSDVVKLGTASYSSGTAGWSLVDESSLDTADYYAGLNDGATIWYIVHGFPASALDATKRITSVVIKGDTTLSLGGSNANWYVRDPQTGAVYEVDDFNPGGAQPESFTMTTRPWDSQPWTVEDVRLLQAGFGQNSGPGNSGKIHQLWLEVNWTAPKTVESALAELGAAGPGGEILSHTTAETDDTLVLAPDGAGGVEFRAETAGSGLITKDEGSTIGTATTMDFVGAGVSASYSSGTTTVTVSGGGGSGELAYVQFTSPVSITATTEATGNSVVSAGAVSFDGSTRVCIEFFCPEASMSAAGVLVVDLSDGGTEIGRMGAYAVTGTADHRVPLLLRRFMTPSNASHTYAIQAWKTAGTVALDAGAGGSATLMPGYVRITEA